ncbi:neutral/alkaline non-lysosomal ceramidase N-terminal domain-containing protein [Halorubrum trueperi]|uniref:Neutral/alkaline non-lysosomal ceramidase N-terminal domain-containing protein n=1 Tax=Halorubrum trueperi TaxID=2004704 RepID=A0ABD5UKX6_9EURY
MSDKLSVGVARADMTPPVGIAHASWGAQTHERAVGVDLPLEVTALAISDGQRTTVTLSLDIVILWSEDDVTAIRKETAELAEIPEEHVRVSYTHTHSGPCVNRENWFEEGDEMVDAYLDSLVSKATGTALEAVESMEPARVAAGTGHSEIAVNRRFQRPEDGRMIVGRNPDGPVDYEVGVLRFDTVAGEPLAAVANYACHPITVGPDNDLITPDYPGVVRQTVEESTGATCLFLQGAAGDVGPIHGVAKNGIDEYRPLGRRLGSEVARVWWSLDPRGREERYVETLESGAPLAVYEYDYDDRTEQSHKVVSYDLELPLSDFSPLNEVENDYEEKMAELHRLRESGARESKIQAQAMECRRAELRRGRVDTFGGQSDVIFELQVFTLGDSIAFVTIPGEPFVEIGMEIKARSPFEHTFFSGYSNEKHAYIPTFENYENGGYEVDTTPFTPNTASIVIEETLEVLQRLKA